LKSAKNIINKLAFIFKNSIISLLPNQVDNKAKRDSSHSGHQIPSPRSQPSHYTPYSGHIPAYSQPGFDFVEKKTIFDIPYR
jgi:hypothetical protein